MRNNYGSLRDIAWGVITPSAASNGASSYADYTLSRRGKEANRREYRDVNKSHPNNPFTKTGNSGAKLSSKLKMLRFIKSGSSLSTPFLGGFLGGGYLYCRNACAFGYEK